MSKAKVELAKLQAERAVREANRARAAGGKPKVSASVPAAKKPVAPKAKPATIKADESTPVKAEDIAEDIGEQIAPGVHVPEELADTIVDPSEEDEKDEEYSPGLLIPPGLEEVVSAVADIDSLDANTELHFTLYPHIAAGAETVKDIVAGAHWMLCANGEPLAKISLKDQDKPEAIAAHFVSNDYARSVVDGIRDYGLTVALKHVKAKPYVAVIDRNKSLQAAKAKLQASADESLRQKLASVVSKVNDSLTLAITASVTSPDQVENPLREALIAGFKQAGLDEHSTAEIVDNSLFAHGPKTFANILVKAQEWGNLADGERKLVTEFISASVRRAPAQAATLRAYALRNPNYNTTLAASFHAESAPISMPQASTNEVVPRAAVQSTAVAPAMTKEQLLARWK